MVITQLHINKYVYHVLIHMFNIYLLIFKSNFLKTFGLCVFLTLLNNYRHVIVDPLKFMIIQTKHKQELSILVKYIKQIIIIFNNVKFF